MVLGVGLFETGVRHPLLFRCPAREINHARGQIHAQCKSVGRTACGVAGGLAAATPDVEHIRFRINCGSLEEVAVISGDPLVQAFGVRCPEITRIPVPVA